MTYDLNLKCIWEHPTTGNHLEITKIVRGEVEKPILITVRSLRLTQPGTCKIPIKQRHRSPDQPAVVSGRIHQVSILH